MNFFLILSFDFNLCISKFCLSLIHCGKNGCEVVRKEHTFKTITVGFFYLKFLYSKL